MPFNGGDTPSGPHHIHQTQTCSNESLNNPAAATTTSSADNNLMAYVQGRTSSQLVVNIRMRRRTNGDSGKKKNNYIQQRIKECPGNAIALGCVTGGGAGRLPNKQYKRHGLVQVITQYVLIRN